MKERNIDTVSIAGYMTQICCDTTARQAFHRGYKVEFLRDATGTLDVENNSIDRNAVAGGAKYSDRCYLVSLFALVGSTLFCLIAATNSR